MEIREIGVRYHHRNCTVHVLAGLEGDETLKECVTSLHLTLRESLAEVWEEQDKACQDDLRRRNKEIAAQPAEVYPGQNIDWQIIKTSQAIARLLSEDPNEDRVISEIVKEQSRWRNKKGKSCAIDMMTRPLQSYSPNWRRVTLCRLVGKLRTLDKAVSNAQRLTSIFSLEEQDKHPVKKKDENGHDI